MNYLKMGFAIRSFGRIKTRKLSSHKEDLLTDLLPKYEVKEVGDQSYKRFINKFSKIHLEIGFGFGDFTFETAKNNPDIGFIASEVHINGVVNLMAKLEKEPLDNVKIFKSDIRIFLEQVPQQLFDKIYILFPDPWPKVKHHKRRLIDEEFLQILSQKMSVDSTLIIATDHDSYKRWILAKMNKVNLFQWQAKSKADWQQFPDDWIYTKYQKKAAREGRTSIILKYIRQS